MAFKLQPGLILGGNLTLSPTGTPFIKDANWSKASTKPILLVSQLILHLLQPVSIMLMVLLLQVEQLLVVV